MRYLIKSFMLLVALIAGFVVAALAGSALALSLLENWWNL